jgi:hypothetical protein
MNKLFVFGDSYSAHYDSNNQFFVDYVKYLNGELLPEIWPVLLSKKLNLQLENVGICGACNYTIFEDFCKKSHNISENDVIIIGWSSLERFRFYDDRTKFFKCYVPQFNDTHTIKNVSKHTVEEIFYNRSYDEWVNEVRSWENLIKKLQSMIKFKLILWSFDVRINHIYFNFYTELINRGAKTIKQETNNKINDGHYGKMGHIQQSEFFYEKINDMDSSNYIKL